MGNTYVQPIMDNQKCLFLYQTWDIFVQYNQTKHLIFVLYNVLCDHTKWLEPSILRNIYNNIIIFLCMIMLPVQLLVWTVVSAVSLCMILLIIAYLCNHCVITNPLLHPNYSPKNLYTYGRILSFPKKNLHF